MSNNILKLIKLEKGDIFASRLEYMIEVLGQVDFDDYFLNQMHFKLLEARMYYDFYLASEGHDDESEKD